MSLIRPLAPLSGFFIAASLLFTSLPAQSDASSAAPAAVLPEQINVTGNAKLEHDRDGVVQVRLEQASGRASVLFNYPQAKLDLSAYRDALVAVTNRASAELDISVTVLSNLSDLWRHSTQSRFFVRPGEASDLHTFIPRPSMPASHPLVKQVGNLYSTPWGYQRHWSYPQADAIIRVAVNLTWHNADAGQTVDIAHPAGAEIFSIDPALTDTLEKPWVDTFGQERGRTWPGKVTTVDDLRADAAENLALIANVTRPRAGLSQYGGYLDGPAMKATGFFRVEKIDGKWWFIDPEGHLFWSVGVNTAAQSPDTRVTGRKELFPKSVQDREKVSFHADNLKLKFGEDAWRQRHIDLTAARMLDWGLNTTGGWSAMEVAQTKRVPYTLIVHTFKEGLGSIGKIPDPYADEWKNSLHSNLERLAAEHAQSPWLLGVFIHNELSWSNGNTLAEQVFNLAKRTPARAALETFLAARHGDITTLNQAWGSSFASFASIRTLPAGHASEAYTRDLTDFMVQIADTYFRVCREAMDQHFPNHLYLGCRFHTFNPIVIAASSRYCDVVSVNLYRTSVADYNTNTEVDRPLIIGEFHFGIRDYGNWGVGLTWAADARNQADLFQAYMSEALRHPNMVGAHWFQWSDQIITGRGDGENFGVGLVTVTDRPNPTLIEAIRNVSNALYSYRLSPTPTRIGAPSASQ